VEKGVENIKHILSILPSVVDKGRQDIRRRIAGVPATSRTQPWQLAEANTASVMQQDRTIDINSKFILPRTFGMPQNMSLHTKWSQCSRLDKNRC
jgi:hypothetical protein